MLKTEIATLAAAALLAAPAFALDPGSLGGSLGGATRGLDGARDTVDSVLGTVQSASPRSSASPTAESEPTALIGLPIITDDGSSVGRATAVRIGDEGSPVAVNALLRDGDREVEVQFPVELTTLGDGAIRLRASNAELRAFLALNATAEFTAAVPEVGPALDLIPDTGAETTGIAEAILATERQDPLTAIQDLETAWLTDSEAMMAPAFDASRIVHTAAPVFDLRDVQDAPEFVLPDAAVGFGSLFAGDISAGDDNTAATPAPEDLTEPELAIAAPIELATAESEVTSTEEAVAVPLQRADASAASWPIFLLPLVALLLGLCSRPVRARLMAQLAKLRLPPHLSEASR